MQVRRGVCRRVFLIGNYAIKFPSSKHGHSMLLKGMSANWEEWDRYRTWKHAKGHKYLCPVVFCAPFGLFQIMRRAKQYIVNPSLFLRLLNKYNACVDIDPTGTSYGHVNVGVYNRRPVILDYGDIGFYID